MDNALQELLYTLQEEPKPEEVKAQDGRLYVPIGFIEAKLDRIFHGLWKTENVQTTVIGNEVCMTLELHVFFYPMNQWVVRTGAGAAMIQQRGDYDPTTKKKIPARPSDVDAKISNTLAKDYPHAKAEATKNAARSLGRTFGRDLNRDADKKVLEVNLPAAGIDEKKRVSGMIEQAQSIQELGEVWELAGTTGLVKMFNLRKGELKQREKLLSSGGN
ncbi:MAG TPA: hypothetical protein PLC89_20310 [Haliscomenobacter sp.]|jgi:hypothetical protein|uniref:hypothetical protein n=1 Tax=Haliscomenobacter sp. TaxID=2717303 RepID=UPI002CF78058|nr:hypothetical protein [Haliscomenobacter sp.]HOY19667.1 hypothetical protein [Haliscomenobacter sp.]